MRDKRIVISDTGVILSIAILNKLFVFDDLFEEVFIPQAVWNEINAIHDIKNSKKIKAFFEKKVRNIQGDNTLSLIMDYGESESVLLYKELKADILLIDDKQARKIAESLNVHCVGTLGLLNWAKEKGIIKELRPLFLMLLKNKRYYAKDLLNILLKENEEKNI